MILHVTCRYLCYICRYILCYMQVHLMLYMQVHLMLHAGTSYVIYAGTSYVTCRYILATQNEEIGAREMFPCFDEPDLKATFNVTVGHQSSVTALSNMPVIDRITRYIFSMTRLHCTYRINTAKLTYGCGPIGQTAEKRCR
jgi:Peptidase M1 N-terminal domain